MEPVVEGRFEFPQGIFFLGDCLGLEARFEIDGEQGLICLPTATLDGDDTHRPDLTAPSMASPGVMEAIPNLPWGYIYNGKDGHFAAERCYLRITLSVSEDEVEERARRIAYLIPFWFERVRDWIEVLTGQDLYEHERPWTERTTRPYGSFFLFGGDGPMDVTHREGVVLMPWPIEQSLSPSNWRVALAAASDNRQPRPEHLIMRDARAAFARDHLRKAVVDAGSATELALTHRIRERLKSRNEEEVIDSLLQSHPALGRRIELAKKLSIDLPEDVRDLVNTRNDAVHRGVTPDPVVAMKALQIANGIVAESERAAPWEG